MKGKGRHDVCVVPRAIPVVEAMAALVMADHFLRYQTSGSCWLRQWKDPSPQMISTESIPTTCLSG